MKKLNEKIARPITDDMMAMVNGGTKTGDGQTPPKYKVGQHIKVNEFEEFDDMIILKILWWTEEDGWDYEINAHMPLFSISLSPVACDRKIAIHTAVKIGVR